MDEIATFFRHVRPSIPANEVHPCIDIIDKMRPVLVMVLEKQGKQAPVAEALCRMFRNSMESYKQYFYPLLERLVPLIISAYTTTLMPCYIWVSGHAVRIFGAHQECHPILNSLLDSILTHVHIQLQSGTLDDETIEEYLYLLVSTLKYAPTLVPGPQLEQTLLCSIHCLSIATPTIFTSFVDYVTQLLIHAETNSIVATHIESMLSSLLKAMCQLFTRDRQVVDDVASLMVPLRELAGDSLVGLIGKAVSTLSIPSENQVTFLTNFTK